MVCLLLLSCSHQCHIFISVNFYLYMRTVGIFCLLAALIVGSSSHIGGGTKKVETGKNPVAQSGKNPVAQTGEKPVAQPTISTRKLKKKKVVATKKKPQAPLIPGWNKSILVQGASGIWNYVKNNRKAAVRAIVLAMIGYLGRHHIPIETLGRQQIPW